MAASFPLSFAPAPPAAGGSVAINLPFALSATAVSAAGATDTRTSAVVRAIAAAVDLRSPEIALRVERLAREQPENAVPPGTSKQAELDELNQLIKAVDDAYRDTSKDGTVTDAVKAHAAAAGADPRLVAVARDKLQAIAAARPAGAPPAVSADENAARWVASINLDVFTNATRAGARSAGLALVPTPASDADDLRKAQAALRADLGALKQAHDTLKQAHDTLQQQHDTLRADFDELSAAHTTTRQGLDDLRAMVTKLGSSHEALQRDVESSREATSESFKELYKRIQHLESGGGGGRGKTT